MVELIKTGLFDTIQDIGRNGYQHFGVPYSGVMDRYSANLANALLGNEPNDAVIESVFTGPTLKFHSQTKICLSGAKVNVKHNDTVVTMNTPITVNPGDLLQIGTLHYGCRLYIAVLGGFQTELVMGSRSMYSNITKMSCLKKGDVLKLSTSNEEVSNPTITLKPLNFDDASITVYKGPEFETLDTSLKSKLFQIPLTVSSSSNRMAYQFEQQFKNNLDAIITSLVLPGTVQLTPSGQLIVLMRDCQTTGGYPRILQLSEVAIDRLAQKRPQQAIQFKLLD